MEAGAPVFNLKSAFPYLVRNDFPTPCHQCVVMENGRLSTCGRCIAVPGLCEKCGYFFVAEYTLLFRGNVRIILEMLGTYLKYIWLERQKVFWRSWYTDYSVLTHSRNPKTPHIRSFFCEKWLLFGVLRVPKSYFFMQAWNAWPFDACIMLLA